MVQVLYHWLWWSDLTLLDWRNLTGKTHSSHDLHGNHTCSSWPETHGLTIRKKNYLCGLCAGSDREEFSGSHGWHTGQAHTGCSVHLRQSHESHTMTRYEFCAHYMTEHQNEYIGISHAVQILKVNAKVGGIRVLLYFSSVVQSFDLCIYFLHT